MYNYNVTDQSLSQIELEMAAHQETDVRSSILQSSVFVFPENKHYVCLFLDRKMIFLVFSKRFLFIKLFLVPSRYLHDFIEFVKPLRFLIFNKR